jgi:hypothetical protein
MDADKFISQALKTDCRAVEVLRLALRQGESISDKEIISLVEDLASISKFGDFINRSISSAISQSESSGNPATKSLLQLILVVSFVRELAESLYTVGQPVVDQTQSRNRGGLPPDAFQSKVESSLFGGIIGGMFKDEIKHGGWPLKHDFTKLSHLFLTTPDGESYIIGALTLT